MILLIRLQSLHSYKALKVFRGVQ